MERFQVASGAWKKDNPCPVTCCKVLSRPSRKCFEATLSTFLLPALGAMVLETRAKAAWANCSKTSCSSASPRPLSVSV
eukprot:673870-Lingulodinium_polyedra.AAC.1